MRAAFTTLFLVCIIAFGGIWYYLYHSINSSHLGHIESLSAVVQAPATVCKSATADATGSGEGSMYTYKGRIVLDTMTIPWNNTPAHLRVLIDADKNYWLDTESSDAVPPGLGATAQKAYIDNIIISNDWDCSPWWLPDEAVFNSIPHGGASQQ